MNCPKCKSENTRRFQIVYEEGTYKGEAQHHSTSYSGRDTYYTSTTTDIHGITKLAERCSPPLKARPFIRLFVINFLGIIICFILFLINENSFRIFDTAIASLVAGVIYIGFLGLSIKMFLSGLKYNRNEFIEKNKEWLDSWICLKCGNEYFYNFEK